MRYPRPLGYARRDRCLGGEHTGIPWFTAGTLCTPTTTAVATGSPRRPPLAPGAPATPPSGPSCHRVVLVGLAGAPHRPPRQPASSPSVTCPPVAASALGLAESGDLEELKIKNSSTAASPCSRGGCIFQGLATGGPHRQQQRTWGPRPANVLCAASASVSTKRCVLLLSVNQVRTPAWLSSAMEDQLIPPMKKTYKRL